MEIRDDLRRSWLVAGLGVYGALCGQDCGLEAQLCHTETLEIFAQMLACF